MLRQTTKKLFDLGFRSLTTSAARFEEAVSSAGPAKFAEAWAKHAPSTMELPLFPSSFVKPDETVQGDLFPVNFYTPEGIICDGVKKDTVVLPGIDGVFGVKANHVPTIAQLKPGLVELHTGADVIKYFISGGFAFVHPTGVTDICAVEAATLDQIDPAAVKAALQATAGEKADEYSQAVNRAAQELYGALDSALEQK
jgi:F-type H+-transporting ATPase subunit delta